jgi:glycosyltransferase involved in cell wall biosynthesis
MSWCSNLTKTVFFIAPGRLPIPSEKGAIEEIIRKVSIELSKRGFNVLIFNPLSSNPIARHIKIFKLYNIKQLSSYGNTVFHFHDISLCLTYTRTLDAKSVVLTLHYPPWRTRTKSRFLVMHLMLKHLTNRGIAFAAPSKAIVYWLRNIYKARTFLLPNGVDTSLFHPSKRNDELRERLLSGKEIMITYVARVHPEKNQLDLLKATKILIENYSLRNFKLAFIGPLSGAFGVQGSNPYYILLRSYIERNDLKDYVMFLGEVPNKEVVAVIMASSDIYVHTSIVEAATPLAVMEAMASGLPIIVYNIPFYDFLVNCYNAIIIEKGDVNQLAARLATIIEDKNLRLRLGRNAREFAENNLSWSNIVERYYIRVYN